MAKLFLAANVDFDKSFAFDAVLARSIVDGVQANRSAIPQFPRSGRRRAFVYTEYCRSFFSPFF
jgi:hypothetical protein